MKANCQREKLKDSSESMASSMLMKVGIHTFVRVFYYAPVNGKKERIRNEVFVKRRK